MKTFPPIPSRLAHLPVDPRGYPIPWGALRAEDGTPFFTVNDDRKYRRALLHHLCPICGDRLGDWRWYVGGPRSAFSVYGWFLDLPGHRECVRFALTICPYLAMPKYLGRIDVAHPEKLPPEARILLDETMDPERPALFVAVVGEGMEIMRRDPPLSPYTRPKRPLRDYEFWRHGEPITDAEALPVLRGIFGPDWQLPPRRV